MTVQEISWPSSNGKDQLHLCLWRPEGPVQAVLQIFHGMVEFIERYDDFARYLNQRGIMVVGNDHLGHGASVHHPQERGHYSSNSNFDHIIEDSRRIMENYQQEFPNRPYFIFGHSMGSFIARSFLSKYGNKVSGAVICGTGSQPLPLLLGGIALTSLIGVVKGWRYPSPLIDQLAFGGYNKKFQPTRTKKDWLTRDPQEVAAYLADPRTQFIFSTAAYQRLFRLIRSVSTGQHARQLPEQLPLLIISGANDPVGDFGKGVAKVIRLYQRNGRRPLTSKLYPDCRHELLNELGKENIYQDIYDWLQNIIQKTSKTEHT